MTTWTTTPPFPRPSTMPTSSHGPLCPAPTLSVPCSPPSRSHVRIPWSGLVDNLNRLLRGRSHVLLWTESRVTLPVAVHASAFLNHWTSGTLSLQGQITQWIPIVSSAVSKATRHPSGKTVRPVTVLPLSCQSFGPGPPRTPCARCPSGPRQPSELRQRPMLSHAGRQYLGVSKEADIGSTLQYRQHSHAPLLPSSPGGIAFTPRSCPVACWQTRHG